MYTSSLKPNTSNILLISDDTKNISNGTVSRGTFTFLFFFCHFHFFKWNYILVDFLNYSAYKKKEKIYKKINSLQYILYFILIYVNIKYLVNCIIDFFFNISTLIFLYAE